MKTPTGWHLSGNAKQHYEIGIDTKVKYQGKQSGYITSTVDSDQFATLMQSFQPSSKYLEKRLQLTAYIKTEKVTKWTGLWMRIDGPQDKELGFDNMLNRPINGDTDWTQYSIVLDVPRDVVFIAFGVLLVGSGKVWIDKIEFKLVDDTVPVTDMNKSIRTEPINLGFEETS
ncbi:hypothetical protein BH09PAT2_BH09PAT2_08220 [soil metagenome]